jgi:hypothetical protein
LRSHYIIYQLHQSNQEKLWEHKVVKVSNALSFRSVCALDRMDGETADLLTKTQGTKIFK